MQPSRRSQIPPFHVMEVMKAAAERARVTGDVLHLEVGQPMAPAPSAAVRMVANRVSVERLGYTDALGTAELRAAVAGRYRGVYGVEVDPQDIAITVGASGGFILTIVACFDAGDRVGVTRPGYPAYRNMLSAMDVEVVDIPIGPHNGYVPRAADVAEVGQLDGLVIASPSNPTGTVVPDRALDELIDHCEEAGIWFISDEIYHGITFGGPAPTAALRSDRAIVVQSWSKYFSMTGWRIGWLVLPSGLVRTVERLAQNFFISPPAVSQMAALAALGSTDELDRLVDGYAERRRVVLDGLAAAGLTEVAPADGAFYVWVDVSGLAADSAGLARRWLDEIGVAVTPGIDFDPVDGHRFIRISYSESTPDVVEAMKRIGDWVADRGP